MGAPASFFFFLFILSFIISNNQAADIYTLLYKGCASQSYTSTAGFEDALSALFATLTAQSSSSHFYRTSSGSVSGLYQCRGDLSNDNCYECVHRLPNMVGSLCGRAVAGRVHLGGCYLSYQADGVSQVSESELLYKACGSSEGEGEFGERRDRALGELETGVARGGGFYAVTYGSVYAVAQCEGDMDAAECNACVREAIGKVEEECSRSYSGQVFLKRCYISYNYYPDGVYDHYDGEFLSLYAFFLLVCCVMS